MRTLRTYDEDLKIAQAILNRDVVVTREFLYGKCFPLFFSLFRKYTTDCDNWMEFANEIYVHIMTPNEKTGRCQLENFRGESSIFTWLKVTALYYCYSKFKEAQRMPISRPLNQKEGEEDDAGKAEDFDKLIEEGAKASSEFDNSHMNKQDVNTLLGLMPNARFRELIRLRYIEGLSNEETAERLGMNMDNYYNQHKRAKAQFMTICGKEENHG